MKKLLIISLLLLLPNICFAYPRIANWNYSWDVEASEVETMAQWDLLIIDIEAAHYSPERLREIKELNPDIKILAYISLLDIRADAADLDEGTFRKELGEQIAANPDWVLKNAKGNKLTWWEDYDILNVTGDWAGYFSTAVTNKLEENPNIWDGVFYDNLWEDVSWVGNVDLDLDGTKDKAATADSEWKAGVKSILKKTNNKTKKNFLVTGNSGTHYINNVNGIGFEHFPTTSYGNWVDSLEEYFYVLENADLAIVNTNVNNKNQRTNYKKMRYGLGSALLGDGYYSFDKGDQSHTELWWYDEYEVALGDPLDQPYNILNADHPHKTQRGVWRRDFENGLVLVNSTSSSRKVYLESGYEKIKGDQDPDTNNGKLIGSLTIPAHDGIILLGKLAQIIDVPYVNGGYSKVFNSDGDLERNSFYSYNSNYPGGTQIVEIPAKDKTVVADQTYIYVYKNDKLKYKFAPYGENFTGGVNIAVDKIYKKDSKYYIVTGTQQYGPQIRIFNMKGKLKDPGCFPYAESFQGGVNVGVGDLNGDGRMEIISAAGYGGGPHIRILNNKCEVINPGFFAYDKSARFGVNIGVGDLDNDGKAEIVTGPGPGGAPHIRIFNKNGKIVNNGFYAYDQSDTSGVLVGITDIDQNGSQEIVTSSFGIYNY